MQVWDIFSTVLTMLTLMLLPLQLAFEEAIGLDPAAMVLSASTDVFFVADVVLQVSTEGGGRRAEGGGRRA